MLQLINGQNLKVTVTVSHIGQAYNSAVLYASIWKRTTLDPHNEIQGLNSGVVPLTGIQNDVALYDYSKTLTIPISNVGGAGGATPGQYYGVYVKLYNLPSGQADMYWYGTENDIDLQPLGVGTFSDLRVTYTKG
jgi:hypothetical protein